MRNVLLAAAAAFEREADNVYRFRWAVCQLDALGNCRSWAILRRSLASLPLTLDRTYDRILSAISKEDSEYAIRILRWLTFCARPLSIDEIAEVIAIDIEHEEFDSDEVLEDPWEVLNICSSLITVAMDKEDEDQSSPKYWVALAHYSVKEYLLSDRILEGEVAHYGMQGIVCHDAIARGCLAYLAYFSQSQQPSLILTEENFQRMYKLADYSAKFWISHAQKTGDQKSSTNRAVLRLLSEDNPTYLNWHRVFDFKDLPNWHRHSRPEGDWHQFKLRLEDIPHPLYHAARAGLKNVVHNLLENCDDPDDVRGGKIGSPLAAASMKGHAPVVRLLLDNGADPHFTSATDWGSPLNAASSEGREEVVQILLDYSADPNIQDEYDCHPLCSAVGSGHDQVV